MDARIAAWLARDPDPETHAELLALSEAGDWAGLKPLFAQRLAFGTAGLRGLMGPGPARMNRLVVRETTLGLGQALLAHVPDAARRGVVVGFDGRARSRLFAADVADMLEALGIHVRLFSQEVPTPVVGYLVRADRAAAGVVITASHNPRGYNGYKIYWENGAQIVPPQDATIAAAIETAARAPLPPLAASPPPRERLGEAETRRYLQAIAGLSVHPPSPERARLRLAYTPLHGVGAPLAEAALAAAGFADVHTVASQRAPDGAFPTLAFPNPEEPGSMDAVLALAEHIEADLALANDPDADRLAVAVRLPAGGYRMLTGDQIGVLLAADRLVGAGPEAVVGTTLVSSRMLAKMAQAQGVHYFETLTGFKWLAQGLLARRAQGQRPLLAYEEALGYAVGDVVSDKDGISALLAFAELCADCARTGEHVLDRLLALYCRFGLHLTGQWTQNLSPEAAAEKMASLRAAPPKQWAGQAIEGCLDLSAPQAAQAAQLPTSDVLVYTLSGKARIIVRPSGTEPKLKWYYEICAELASGTALAQAEAEGNAQLASLMHAHRAQL